MDRLWEPILGCAMRGLLMLALSGHVHLCVPQGNMLRLAVGCGRVVPATASKDHVIWSKADIQSEQLIKEPMFPMQ